MLFPMWATHGYLQPFEFDGMDDEDRNDLQADLQQLLDCSAAVIVPASEADEASSDANRH
jgi:hypothetical protein